MLLSRDERIEYFTGNVCSCSFVSGDMGDIMNSEPERNAGDHRLPPEPPAMAIFTMLKRMVPRYVKYSWYESKVLLPQAVMSLASISWLRGRSLYTSGTGILSF